MKNPLGTSSTCAFLKSFSSKVGGMLYCGSIPNKYKILDTKLEGKIMEVKRSSSAPNKFRSVNSIILRFPQFREGLKEVRGVFEKCDLDSNGIIDHKELKNCFQKLNLQLKEEEIDDLYGYCSVDGTEGIQFDEFIVLLCLVYLLLDPSTTPHSTLELGSPQLKATFDAIIEAFLFLDKNGDGKLNKKDMISAMNDASQFERSPTHITRTRFSENFTFDTVANPLVEFLQFLLLVHTFQSFWFFEHAEEMDWDRNGQVSFREFLFALIKWVGIGSDDEIPVIEC